MSRQPSPGEGSWKGVAILVGAVVLGLLVFASFPQTTNVSAGGAGTDQPKDTTTTLSRTATIPSTTATSIPLKDPKDVKVLVANGTTTAGATRKVIDALKPGCYAVNANGVDALPKIKSENRETSTVYSTPGFERESSLIAQKLGLAASAVAALPPESPIPTRGQPSFSVLVLVAKDLVDKPPAPLPGAECATTTTSSRSATTARASATTRAPSTTAARATTTTRAITTTSQKPTTTAPS